MAAALFIARLIECDTTRAVAEVEGQRIMVSTALVPDAENGDRVLVQYGFALRRLEAPTDGSVPPGTDFPADESPMAM